VDHCVGNVALGDMNQFVDFYRDVLGFSQLIHYDDKVIHTEYSALM
jgi:4-hydroxyphenylpyruvate dioxygenase